ncbi:MAG: histidine kinase N-terminal 7TM domain-containing protein, partial [Candidatus Rokuibacteriota bacterium]
MMPIVGLGIVVAIELGLAIAVLARNPGRPVNRWFAAYTGALAAWGTVNALFRLLPDPAVTLIVARAAFAAAAMIAVTFFRFATVFPHRQPGSPGVLQAVTLIGLFVAGLAFSPWIVESVRLEADTPQPVYGPLHLVFGVYFVVCYGWALVHLVGKLRRAKGFARAQLQYLFLGTGLGCVGGVTTNLVVPLVFGTSRFNLYGPYFTLILVAFTAHAVIRYRLMDIRVVVSRSAAYAAGWAVTAGIVVGGGIVFSELMLGSDPSPLGDLLLGLGAGFCAVLLAPRMRTLADRYLYRPA